MSRLPTLLAATLLLAACGRKDVAAPPSVAPPSPAAGPAQPAAAVGVRLVVPEKVRFTPHVEATGVLRAREASNLAFSISGTLRTVPVRRGQVVAEGATLAVLDADVVRASLAQAEAGVAAAHAQARLAQDAFERSKRLRAQESISESQFVQAEAQRDLASAQARAAEAAMRQAQVNLEKHSLKAPFPGVITRVPDGTGIAVAAGQALVAIEGTKVLVLDTSLTQDEASTLRAGQPVAVVVAETGARAPGAAIRLVLPSVDPGTGRVPVEIAIPNADGRLLPHAFARVTFPAGAERDAWKVPVAALLQKEGAVAVWAAGPDGRARPVPVKLLDQSAGDALVDPGTGGWPVGLRVVASPPLGISEGAALAGAAP
jgi:RND family efflux transporter MFP subunit